MHTLGVDVQSSFDQAHVRIQIDGFEILNKTLQTNYVLSFCSPDGRVVTKKRTGSHTITVWVNNTFSTTEIFQLENDLYIGVNYNPATHGISFIYSNSPFLYD